ncbi:hypothetical protein C7S17_6199 [Burkholderia thailandensis]|nr:hypothetical protein [Burkholderia thailandensis]
MTNWRPARLALLIASHRIAWSQAVARVFRVTPPGTSRFRSPVPAAGRRIGSFEEEDDTAGRKARPVQARRRHVGKRKT